MQRALDAGDSQPSEGNMKRLRLMLVVSVVAATIFALPAVVGAQLDPETGPDDPDAPEAEHNLSGVWRDDTPPLSFRGSPMIRISQDGSTVIGQYLETQDCDLGETGHYYTDFKFSGQLSGDTVQGETSVGCNGPAIGNDIEISPMTATVNAADTQISVILTGGPAVNWTFT